MTTKKDQTDQTAEDDGPDLSDPRYCEHGRTQRVCETCQAEGKVDNARPELNQAPPPTLA